MAFNKNIFFRLAGRRKIESISIDETLTSGVVLPVILKEIGSIGNDVFACVNGVPLSSLTTIGNDEIIDVYGRLDGGKGGFGSMLRAIGAQIEKTTNREACRDLAGRRLRAINDERRYRHYMNKKLEHDREREEKRRKKLESLARDRPKHEFNDSEYFKEKEAIPERVEDAVEAAFNEESPSGSGVKRPATSDKPSKKMKGWFGDLEMMDESDDDEEVSSSESSGRDCGKEDSANDDEDVAKAGEGEKPQEVKQVETEVKVEKEEKQDIKNVETKSKKQEEKVNPVKDEVQENTKKHKQDEEMTEKKPDVEVPKNVPEEPLREVDLEACAGVEELLEMYTPNELKNALMTRNVKCGGSPRERAERLWSVKGLSPDQIPKKLLAKK